MTELLVNFTRKLFTYYGYKILIIYSGIIIPDSS